MWESVELACEDVLLDFFPLLLTALQRKQLCFQYLPLHAISCSCVSLITFPSHGPEPPLSFCVCQHSGESSFRLPLSNRLVSRSRRLADRHPGAAGGRRRGDPLGLPGGPDFPLQGDAEAPLPHRGRVALHRRYVFVSLSVTLLPKVVKK